MNNSRVKNLAIIVAGALLSATLARLVVDERTKRSDRNFSHQVCLAIQPRIQLGATRAILEYVEASLVLTQRFPRPDYEFIDHSIRLHGPGEVSGFRKRIYPCEISGRTDVEVTFHYFYSPIFNAHFILLSGLFFILGITLKYFLSFMIRSAQAGAIQAIESEISSRLGLSEATESESKNQIFGRFFQLDSPALRNAQDKILALESTISERERTIAGQQTKVALVEVASQVAHDIRAPLSALTAVTGTADGLRQETKDQIYSAITRLRAIADDMLEKNRAGAKMPTLPPQTDPRDLDTTETELDRDPEPIFPLIESILAEKKSQCQERTELKFELATDTVSAFGCFRGSAPDIQRILSNLLTNSVEAIEEAGAINILLTSDEKWLRIAVSDSGCGISPELLPKVILPGGTFGKPTGNGMGLSWACRTIEKLGGQLSIQSEVKKGTVVTLKIPREEHPHWLALPEICIGDTLPVFIALQPQTKALLKERLCMARRPMVELSTISDVKGWYRSELPDKKTIYFCELFGNWRNSAAFDVLDALGIGAQTILIYDGYGDSEFIERCTRLGTRVLPRSLTSSIKFELE